VTGMQGSPAPPYNEEPDWLRATGWQRSDAEHSPGDGTPALVGKVRFFGWDQASFLWQHLVAALARGQCAGEPHAAAFHRTVPKANLQVGPCVRNDEAQRLKHSPVLDGH
jgi:hypothetical protein